ncbi:hypothetical protein MGH68_15215 [Erysipelothrix sp. D19-032]
MSKQDYTSVFDIIGPVMTGPSSSHTLVPLALVKLREKFLGRRRVCKCLSI